MIGLIAFGLVDGFLKIVLALDAVGRGLGSYRNGQDSRHRQKHRQRTDKGQKAYHGSALEACFGIHEGTSL